MDQTWTPCQVHGHNWSSDIDADAAFPDHCTDCGETREDSL